MTIQAAPPDAATAHAADEAFAEILFSPEGRVDPYSRYRRIREAVPVHHSAMGIWVLSRYDDVNDSLRSKQVGKNVRTFMAGRFSGDWEQHSALRKLASTMLWADPPEHTRLRRIVTRAFTTKRVLEHQAFIERRLGELLDPIAEAGGGDICNDLCFPLPLSVVARLVGVPQDEAPLLREPIRDFQRTFELGMTAADLRKADEAADFLDDYYGDLVRQRQRRRADDLLSSLIDIEDDGERLSFAELVQMCHMVIAAGSETTTYFLTNGIRLFIENPGQADLLRADPALLSRAIDEVLRFDPPAHMIPRTVSEPTEIGGTLLPEGARLMILIAAANRDPVRFTDPERFDVTRAESPPISFGAGIHACPGWRLARMQAEIVFPALVGRYPRMEVTEPLRHRARVAFPQVEALHIRLGDRLE
ncbi:cytochrome P450 [Frankia sp. EI5c]|uniref:cytochrome P450 n=1 Tax=Frankia sp. EI5c TaxID=683316 RepID=UPI0007C326E8|nr:cytochrome P450 [Frankia sp. EI5c]OAA28772.1 cytochrome P450 [Frankia sp. EI5c]